MLLHLHERKFGCVPAAFGIGSVLADDPRLTVRLPDIDHGTPERIVLDSNWRLPADARLLAEPGAILVVVGVLGAVLESVGVCSKVLCPGWASLRSAALRSRRLTASEVGGRRRSRRPRHVEMRQCLWRQRCRSA